VEPERFDDVAFRIVEGPEPPKRRRRGRRWVVALTACGLTTGALAAGASALVGGGNGDGRVLAPSKPAQSTTDRGWTSYAPDGHGCRKGGHHGERERLSQVRY
jgi:hypothetical protein